MIYFFLRILVISILLCPLSQAAADIYKYTDDSGSVCMTNTLNSVPKKYRSSMTVIKEESPAQKTLLPQVQKRNSDPLPYVAPQAQQAVEQEVKSDPVQNRQKYVRTGLIVAGIIAGYFLLTRLMGTLGFPRIGTLLFLALALVGGVYLYGLYIKEMKEVFGTLRKDAHNIKKNVESRESKTEQMLKKLPEAE